MRHRRAHISILMATALTACMASRAIAADASPEVDLSPRFTLNAPAHYQHQLTMTQRQRYRDHGEGVVSLQMTTDLRLEVTRLLSGGGAEVELTFERMIIDAVPSSEPHFRYDTEIDHDRSDTEPYVNAIRRVANSAVIFELSSSGQVRTVIGARDIERLVESQPGFELIAGVLNERWFREVAQDVFGAAGADPTRSIDESWRTQLALTLGGFSGAGTQIEWSLRQVADGVAIIEGDGAPKSPVKPDPGIEGVKQQVTGTLSKMRIEWDLAKGRARLVEKSEAMSLNFHFEGFTLGTASLGTHSLLRATDPIR